MFRKILFAAFLQTLCSAAFAQSFETRQTEPFTGIKIESNAKVHLRQAEPVSYTHLRAHETVLDLVCRLLLEKKKHNITTLT